MHTFRVGAVDHELLEARLLESCFVLVLSVSLANVIGVNPRAKEKEGRERACIRARSFSGREDGEQAAPARVPASKPASKPRRQLHTWSAASTRLASIETPEAFFCSF